jgi:putative heavy-metal-binding protein
MQGRFWISTGEIREQYETINVIGTKVSVDAPAFGRIDYAKAFRIAVDELARAAVQLGANGVIWIRFDPFESPLGFDVYASGTVVKVS